MEELGSSEVIVVGGGFSGAILAAALADGRRRVLVLEARRGPRPSYAGELIHPTGVDVLAGLGLLPALEAAGARPARGFALSASAGAPPMVLPYTEVPGGRGEGLTMEHHALVATLRTAARARPGVRLVEGARVVDVLREDGRVVGIRTEDGREARAPLTLIAAGRHAALRSGLDLPADARLLSYTAVALLRDLPLPRPGHGHVFLGAPGPILAYEVDDRQIRLCLDLPVGERHDLASARARLRAAYVPVLPEPMRSALDRALEDGPPELIATHAMQTRRCIQPGVALVGDAAGCCHPLTAAGMTICLSDARILAEELDRCGEVEQALERYQERRYPFVRAREMLADALYDVFRSDDPGARAMREGIFSYWRGSRRARATSIGLLSCAESRLAVLAAEYVLVAARSLAAVPHLAEGRQRRLRAVREIGQRSLEQLRIAWHGGCKDLRA